ncbi:Holliday junction resolvase RuvX [Robbsia sp. Bb-Pol-6]|uniref:Putative pre-16S rRNA nuclease n=1 Tax=Robbsia betulipollinis TaxID=2981849 RepID=A0ABT3ZLW7_9BURK|nr:Holliday junction resolvase RuvX [Robbsia betulipollinis]
MLLGFDYGEKRIGVAIGNSLTGSARALGIVENRDRQYRFDEIGKLIAAWQPDTLIVGLPCHPDGAPHAMTQLARRFGNQLNGRFDLPVVWVDERYSSVAARDGNVPRRAPQRGARRPGPGTAIDDEAARIILQQYLDDYAHA